MEARVETHEENPVAAKKKRPRKILKRTLFSILTILLVAGGAIGFGMWNSRYPDKINMGTAGDTTMQMDGMNMPTSKGPGIPVTSLQDPETATHTDTFTLTAQPAHLNLGSGNVVDTWTFNGTMPGPTLRVRQGDLVVVHLVNHLSIGVTIHWHGVDLPNGADGVAGVTQDAVKPGQTYTYHFIAKKPGTYWYHSHEQSNLETEHGLFGMLIVDPAKPTVHDDVDTTVNLHEWVTGTIPFIHTTFLINGSTRALHIPAQPGQWVRLRVVNTSSSQYIVRLLGSPFTVLAIDGHDLNEPTPLDGSLLTIGASQRYDVRFRMPTSNSVELFTADDKGNLQPGPVGVVGQGSAPSTPQSKQWFDFTTYGTPQPGGVTLQSYFDLSSTITMGDSFGFVGGRMGAMFTFNGKAFPSTNALMVQPGQLVKLHLVNDTDQVHPIHLHGHDLIILARNGRPLTGSPVYVNTINLGTHSNYDVAFYANNPGLWMLHCHNLFHAERGMDMMIVYPNISTPFTIGNSSGNFPD